MLRDGGPKVPTWAGQQKDEPFDVKQFLESRAAPADNAAPLYFAALAELGPDMYAGPGAPAWWPWRAPAPPRVGSLGQSIGKLSNADQLRAGAFPLAEVERADVVQQFERGGALAGDDVRMIVGRNQSQPAVLREPSPDGLAILAIAIVENDLTTVRCGSHSLDFRRIRRHHDHAWDVEQLAGERNRLRMVARRKGHNAAATFVGIQSGERVVGSPELEGTGTLEVLAFEEERRARFRIQGARGCDRSAMCDTRDLPRGTFYVLISRKVHFSLPSSSS